MTDISAWLDALGLGEYGGAFAANRIGRDVLRELTDQDLRDLGVAALGDRKRLLAAIAALAEEPAAAEGRPAVPTEGERRQVTVLFADIAGFTALSERLGAEATHQVLNRYFGVADRIVEEFGGRIDKHIGDNLMAVFGAPLAHDNDPERAVRAALAIHSAARGIITPEGPLRLHVGIASGQVVASGTGSDAHQEYTVTGDSVNLAARLEGLAEPGQTLVSESVHRHVAGRVSGAALGPRTLKGIAQPVSVYRVDGLADGSAAHRSTPFVGRRSEIGQCHAILAQVAEMGVGQSILLRGTAGIGKTRLAEAVAEAACAAGFSMHRGLVLDFGSRKEEAAVPALVRSLLGLRGSADEDARRAAVDRVVAAGIVPGNPEAFLNDLLDLPQPLELRRVYDAMDDRGRREGRQSVVAGLVQAEARRRPQVIVIEDLHWADAETMDTIAAIMRAAAEHPVLLIGTTRPEGDPFDGAWRALGLDVAISVINLGPLRPAEARAMAGDLVRASDARLAECLERAGGNPLFLEQLLQNANEVSTAVPDSISSLVLARMDRLPAPDRRALQAASIFGQRFALPALRHVIDDPAYDPSPLLGPQLVRPEGEDLLFAHALIRDGVYGSILSAARERLHLRAADWFEARDPALHAEHLALARDPRAASAYLRAAQAEIASYRYGQAIALVEQGRRLATTSADRVALALALGEAMLDTGALKDALAAFAEALDAAEDDRSRCHALLGLAGVKRLTDAHDSALGDLDAAQAIAVRLGLAVEEARAHFIRGNLLFPRGDVEGCVREHSAALALARKVGSAELEAKALGGLGDAEYLRGCFYSALLRFDECVELSKAHGLGRTEVANLPMVAFGAMVCGEVHRANEAAMASIEAARRVGHDRAEMIGHHAAHVCCLNSADLEAAAEHARSAAVLARKLGSRRFEAESECFLAEAEFLMGERETALDRASRAMEMTREVGMTYMGPMNLGTLAFVTDDAGQRRAALDEGEQVLATGTASHNHLFFRRSAIDACLCSGDYDEAERHANALAAYCPEPEMLFMAFLAERGRALARAGRGERDAALPSELDRLVAEGERMSLELMVSALRDARNALPG